jgi:hypothetical protein
MSAILYVLSFRLVLATFSEPFDLLATFLTGDPLPEDCDELFSFRSRRRCVLVFLLFIPSFTSSLEVSTLEWCILERQILNYSLTSIIKYILGMYGNKNQFATLGSLLTTQHNPEYQSQTSLIMKNASGPLTVLYMVSSALKFHTLFHYILQTHNIFNTNYHD